MKQGWEYKKLGEVCTKGSSNISLNKIEENNGEYALFGASGYVKGIDFYHQDQSYIGVVKDGSGVGRVDIYPEKSSLVGTMQYIFPKAGCELGYLKYLLQGLHLEKYKTGAAIPHIYFRDYENCKVRVPKKEEQQKIVSELDLLSGVIEKQKAQLAELDKLAQSIFYDMFGDPVTNEKGWEVKKIKDICKVITGNTPSRNNLEYYNEEYIEWIKTDNILRDSLYPSLAKEYLSEEGAKQGRIADVGSILIACIAGSLESISKCCLLNRKVSFNQQINALVPKEDMNSLFVYSLVNAIADYIRENTTNGMKHIITKSVLEEIRICVPPLSLQQDFAAKVEAIEAMKAKVRQSLKEAETLFNERMDYYFN